MDPYGSLKKRLDLRFHHPLRRKYRRKKPQVSMYAIGHQEDKLLTRYSTLKKLKSVVAYCLRFSHNCKKPTECRTGFLSVTELEEALLVIVKMHQRQHFAREMIDLKQKRPIYNRSKLLCLHPFLEKNGVIRVGGRLKNSTLSYTQKFPMVLASNDHLMELIIREAYLKNLHAGFEALLSVLREQYWIISGRSAVRRVLHRCIVCYRFSCKSPSELMGDLPT